MEGRPLSVLKQRILNSLWSRTFGAYDAFGMQSIVHLLHTRVYCVIWLLNQVAVNIQVHTDQPDFPTKRGGDIRRLWHTHTMMNAGSIKFRL